MKKIPLLSFLFLFFSLTSCLKDKTTPIGEGNDNTKCDTIFSYSENIRPIIESSCKNGISSSTACHDTWIDDYATIKTYIDLDIWQDKVFTKKTMPIIPNDFEIDVLTKEELRAMQCWIDQGYPDN